MEKDATEMAGRARWLWSVIPEKYITDRSTVPRVSSGV